ncbi:hypothetical protein RN001_003402 [Aquatica leii]|uniref:Uncharacterized protein n=1 Tax=Aquatica leii TaxID=1421715 RepID=A0AAN7SDY7_9COLE|nr:hypothetical protein RN001_003402 [Aquatica leii]
MKRILSLVVQVKNQNLEIIKLLGQKSTSATIHLNSPSDLTLPIDSLKKLRILETYLNEDQHITDMRVAEINHQLQKDAVIDPTQSQTESKMLSPEVVRPFPKVKKETTTLRRPKVNQGKSRIYTESPEKRRVEEIEEAKIEKQKKKSEGQKGKLKRTSEEVNSPSTSDVVKMKEMKQSFELIVKPGFSNTSHIGIF